jgi:U32 family peptidase
MSDQTSQKSGETSVVTAISGAKQSPHGGVSPVAAISGILQPDLGAHRVPEILAPAGGREQFFAALNAGADAVFLGLKQFNARSRAENFTIEDLQCLVPMAHRYGMKVLVTLNILIKDIELEELIRTLAELEDVGVNAIIVQDLGVAKIAREYFPGLRLHASTQMAVHNLAGVREAWSYGFKRVVLARELTAEELKRIRRGIADEDVEIEVFCHGSLCYSYSGLCFFSGASDARSGNRGECAYTCREPYKVVSEPGHGFLFSMRDLDTSHKLDQMVLAGVDTLKIEGRKKDAQYVTSVVRLYRKKLDDLFGRPTIRNNAPPLAREALGSEPAIRKDLQLSFQRKTTSFFFEGRYHENVIDLNSPTHNGIRIGVIEGVHGNSMSVRLEDDVEKFDGLKIVPAAKLFHAKPQDGETTAGDVHGLELRYENKEVAFSLREMAFVGRKIYEATAGMVVEIELPAGATAAPGDILFKARSDELRRRVEKMIGVPVDARLRPMISVRAAISAVALDDGGMSLKISISRGNEVIAEGIEMFEIAEERQKGELIRDLKDVFHIFGDEGAYVEEFTFNLAKNYFIPKSRLKDLKRRVEVGLSLAATNVSVRHMDTALSSLDSGRKPLESVNHAHYALKIDRVEYLPWVAEMARGGAAISEVVFEPKKMFLPDIKPETFLTPLIDFQRATGIKLRLAMPTVIRAWDEPVLKKWFASSVAAGITAFEVGNPGALGLLREWQLPLDDVISDFTLYGMNREAVKHWRDQGVKQLALSIEDDFEDLQSLLSHWPEGVVPQAILYKDTPLFVAEACSLTALHNGCPSGKVCGYRTLEIENSKGERFFVAHEGCKSVVYGKQAYSIAGERGRLMASGVSSFRLDFLTRDYDYEAFMSIVGAAINDQKISGTHTANFLGRLK